MKKLVSMLLSLVLLITLIPVKSASAADDITGIALEKEMRAMIEQGIISGYGNGVYAPAENVSRGQFATFIYRALKLPAGEHRFEDVAPSSSLALGINAAAAAKIVNGYSKTIFKPEDNITRSQMAIMIDNAFTYLKISKKTTNLIFTDNKDIGASSSAAISNMVGHGIISGFKDGDGIAFKPHKTATRAEAAAFISRMLDVKKSQGGSTTPEPDPDPAPGEETGDYKIGTLDSNGNMTTSSKSYSTFTKAASAITNANSQVIVKGDKILKMQSGIAVSKPGTGKSTTPIYESNMKTQITYINSGNELEYVSSDEDKITVKLAGKTVYVSHDDAYLIPTQQMTGRSYYSVNSAGDLVFNLYNHSTKKVSATNVVGKAPSSFKQGVKYISMDGANFKLESGASAGTFYQYFNMLPMRTSTKYTAAELESIIKKKLAEREALYTKNPTTYARYKDATKKSKLIGLGQILKDFESSKDHKLNALLILGLAINESDFGMSAHAQNNNNLFGLSVYDSAPLVGGKFNSVRDCVRALSNDYLNKNYIPATAAYANGGMFGNKARGINVKYASDPYWGQKNAGHAYTLDKELGGKDFANQYAIYETTTDNLNVRSSAGTTSTNLLYTYKKAGFPVAVVATEGSWYKILSDSRADQFAYISTSYAKQLPIAK
ncbi:MULTISPECIES: S-layer homology domain-containing protein [Bacillus]|uniref:S-layer homology domain-containing protein n=1 Tax=Bacillus TaxID=1386 RepID=UPI0002E244C5|nr:MULTISPECIES: S-layer homology domain-containing protein [Bacillus]